MGLRSMFDPEYLADMMQGNVLHVLDVIADLFDTEGVRELPMTGATVASIMRDTTEAIRRINAETGETEGTENA